MGLVYASSEDEEEEQEMFIARHKLQSYQLQGMEPVKFKKNTMRFTKGGDPRVKSLMAFLVDESVTCPRFLPLVAEDANLSVNVVEASIAVPGIPLSELIRKE